MNEPKRRPSPSRARPARRRTPTPPRRTHSIRRDPKSGAADVQAPPVPGGREVMTEGGGGSRGRDPGGDGDGRRRPDRGGDGARSLLIALGLLAVGAAVMSARLLSRPGGPKPPLLR